MLIDPERLHRLRLLRPVVRVHPAGGGRMSQSSSMGSGSQIKISP